MDIYDARIWGGWTFLSAEFRGAATLSAVADQSPENLRHSSERWNPSGNPSLRGENRQSNITKFSCAVGSPHPTASEESVEPGAAWTMAEIVKELSEAEQEQLISLAERVEAGAKNAGEYTEDDHRERGRKAAGE